MEAVPWSSLLPIRCTNLQRPDLLEFPILPMRGRALDIAPKILTRTESLRTHTIFNARWCLRWNFCRMCKYTIYMINLPTLFEVKWGQNPPVIRSKRLSSRHLFQSYEIESFCLDTLGDGVANEDSIKSALGLEFTRELKTKDSQKWSHNLCFQR